MIWSESEVRNAERNFIEIDTAMLVISGKVNLKISVNVSVQKMIMKKKLYLLRIMKMVRLQVVY